MRMLAVTVLLLSVGASGLVLSGHAQTAQGRHTLDLTSPGVVKTVPVVIEGSGSARSGQRAPAPLPLRLRLVRIDRTVYELGSPIVYEVELTNIGNQPIGLPWSADLELIKQPGRSFVESTLFLSVGDRPDDQYRLATVILGGSTSVRGSIETILPGEAALIKVASTVIPPPDSQLAGLSAPAQVIYRLSTGPFLEWQDLRSINVLPIAFQRPR